MLRRLRFVCPLCKGALEVQADAYRCAACERAYPLHAGIPDFRVFPDPYLSVNEDRKRTDAVLEVLEQLELQPLLEHYWSMSDVTPLGLRARFVQNALRGELRARRVLDQLVGAQPHGRLIELGCGTGNLLIEARGRFEEVVGVDIAMRWLHLSRRRFMDRGGTVPALVCCCAEYLPFAADTFDAAVMVSTLEFVRDPAGALRESARILRDSGQLSLNTVNRYSLAINPYVQLWGIGFLPHRWQILYARWLRAASFENIRLLSSGDLVRLARQSFAHCTIAPADVHDSIVAGLPRGSRTAVQAYRALRRTPGLRAALCRIAPELDVRLREPLGGDAGAP